MTPAHLRIGLVSWVAIGLVATVAFAQVVSYRSVEATAAAPVQLSYHASAHKNCTPAPLPTVHIIEAPHAGMLTVRRGELTTDRVAGCPTLKMPAQVVIYQAGAGYLGPDHVRYEVTSDNGEDATYDMTITVKAAPATSPPGGDAGAGHS
jgi:hypothetical protein